ncbi:MAG: hypothetical protein HGB36_12655 [Chlorobiaceae bacterium]|nr:hypothetical protein [Chlorobiaceae bacterium]
MTNPFSWLPAELQGSLLLGLAVAALAMAKILSTVGNGLASKEEGIPLGIMNLEISWSTQRAESIVKAWKKRGVIERAVQQTQLDFAFLFIYPAVLSLSCTMISGGGNGTALILGNVLSWAVLLCTPFDAFENFMLLRMLKGTFEPDIAKLTSISASLKFLIILVTLLYLLVMVFMR